MRTERGTHEPGVMLRGMLAVLLLGVASGLCWLLWATPLAPGLDDAVRAALAQSGVENPVTAVLLNFRGYDTLLEIAVMTSTLVGVWALGPAPKLHERPPSPVLLGLDSVLIPLSAVICGYLLWVGATRAGGAFQAGSVLAATGVLFILSGRRPRIGLPHAPMRWGVVLGLATFLVVALAVMGDGRQFLEYPPGSAKTLILVIEAAATLSIAVILAGLFIGGRPGDEP
ncbi:MnhB domain-containing protein [Wenzhouxiangella sp. XN24]|uniref:MnhB domain-containing protein n=1 Tax=Wenzhouxiangella sp. XN24 TaxID=2713569 RepID=UPI0013EAF850|nr:MnhB domain-containing protein [Wenzhouxiangella sp. XN24]NGX15127.1 sodium:proton antiporter [Wenzhouxiangella sp. XN24]